MKNKKIYVAIVFYVVTMILYTTVLFTKNPLFLIIGSATLAIGSFIMIFEIIKETKK